MFGIRKKVLTALILCVTMIITMIPASAFAGDTEYYNLWIGSERVSSTKTSGKNWKYEGNSSKGTLTLTNATITETHEFGSSAPYSSANIYSNDMDITIKLVGQNSLVNKARKGDGIRSAYGTMTITGDSEQDTLDITSAVYGIWNKKGLTFDNANITVHSGDDSIYMESDAANNTINGGRLNLTSSNDDGIDCPTMSIGDNAYITIDAKDHGIVAYEGLTVNDSSLDITSREYQAIHTNEGCDLEINNSDAKLLTTRSDAVCAGNITITDSSVEAITEGTSSFALQAENQLTVSSKDESKQTSVKATTNSTKNPAVFAVSGITLNDDITVIKPEGGAVAPYTYNGSNGEAILLDGGIAAEVVLQGVEKHKVTYKYTGEVPEGAPAVPKDAVYKAGDSVTVEEAPELDGYTFSGWSKTGTFDISNEDVEITGSWTKNPEPTSGPTPTPSPAPAPTVKAPAAPVIITEAKTANGKMLVKWNKVSGATGYVVAYRQAGAAKWKTRTAKTNKITISGLKKGKFYQFKVAAKKGNKRGEYSKISYRYYLSVSKFKAKAGKKSIKLKWKKTKGACGYVVQVSTNKNFSKYTSYKINKGSKTSYTVKKLKSGKKYYVRIRAIRKKSGIRYSGILTQPVRVKAK